ncbi:vesicle-associated protein 1-2-like [Salvia miltiorrhiza]|uniref:vesicle-associated protein 1-2-like n=1 Tax=Salvia miltiorrhiza TaxID=226208 RepID=UPI0025AC3E76|nr:vesicle-associated protein 1-2-like [Salvia miltiorrhiza]
MGGRGIGFKLRRGYPEPLTPTVIRRPAAIRLETSNCELLQIEPRQLQFPFELKKQISCSMQLTNKSGNHVAFKVKTTNPKKYCVRPNTGVVMPYSSCDVTVTMQAQKEAPPDMQCRDKFLLHSVVVNPGISAKDITPKMFNKELGNQVDECKLKVAYVPPPQPPSPVREGSEEGSFPRASLSENWNVNQMLESLTRSIIWRTAAIRLEMSNYDLLQIDPLELQFPFELKKQISCSMQLTNKSEKHVAFKVKTTNPKKFCVRPNTGVVMPHSTCDVTVTMQAQKAAPPDLQCRDKFLLQSVVITPEMFDKESGNQVGECKLRVVYVPPPQPLHWCEDGSEEGSLPRASVTENGTVMSKEFPESNEVTF